MIHSLQMREVPNGCIIIDAQPCRKKLLERSYVGLQTHVTNQVRQVLNPATTLFIVSGNKEDKDVKN